MNKLIIQGKPDTQIGEKYGVNPQSVRYHRLNHLPDKLVKAFKEDEERHAENILSGINDLLQSTKQVMEDAKEDGQKNTQLKAIKEARSTYELLSKIAVKLEEYRREDKQDEISKAVHQVKKGLKALSDTELKAYMGLQAKILSANPEHTLDMDTKRFVNHVTSDRFGDTDSGDMVRTKYSGSSGDGGTAGSDTPSNRVNQPRNNQTHEPDMVDDLDLDLDELDLTEDNTIPSERTDPDWMKR
ncbi:hypothetical protein LQ318_08480 [Aliifodinibius salicampi]|uniref:Uncharacterized protein n=1 Tax=Fodinibius salicampi TaxID=1920655 RepID=A0ABT3PYK2_9BACT|nr:hypothetical protein [Fodinibius salicampi]MCW9712939.1 hypothetical protein [Fodinibius salicampi]